MNNYKSISVYIFCTPRAIALDYYHHGGIVCTHFKDCRDPRKETESDSYNAKTCRARLASEISAHHHP